MPRPLYPSDRATSNYWTGEWVGPWVGLDDLHKIKVSWHCWKLNHGPLVVQHVVVVTIPGELLAGVTKCSLIPYIFVTALVGS